MSIRVDTSSLIPGAIVCGNRGLGVLGSAIPSDGDNGAGYAYNDLTLPADANKEIRGEILTVPSSGSFFAYEDTSFELDGAADGTYTFSYRLYADGADLGTATATIVVGVVNGEAIASITAISLTPPTATAEATANAEAMVAFQQMGLIPPSAVASGTIAGDGLASSAPLSISLSPPVASATASATATASVPSILLWHPNAWASGTIAGDGQALAEFNGMSLVAPRATASGTASGAMTLTPDDISAIAAAVLAALQGTVFDANIKQVNDVTVQGAGTKLNPWQPV